LDNEGFADLKYFFNNILIWTNLILSLNPIKSKI